ncbi:hypothetical protein RDI58_021763 [Solanum bulbocastanum]|uniref:Uncharacterized protein n=1 Tax=Solanum bulbocastanum TaxID=147425 RepID=A0AAN8T1H9_SOLBU
MVQVVEDQQKLDWPSCCKPKNVTLHCSCDGLVLILVSSRGLYKSSMRNFCCGTRPQENQCYFPI